VLQESPSYAQSVLAPPVSGGASGGNAWSVFFDGLADAIVIAALVGELIVVLVNMVLRATLSVSFTWSDEASQFSLIVMAFIGGAMSYRRGEHVVVRVITERLPVRVRERVAVLADCLVFGLSVVVAFLGAAATYQDRGIHTPQLHLSQSLFDAPIVIGMTIIAVHVAFGLFRRSRRGVAVIAIATTALAVGAVAANDHWGPLVSGNVVSGASIIMIGVLLLIGVPITFAFICSALVYFSFSGSVSPLSVPVNMQEGVSSFVLLAIPFFVLAGGIMARGGLSTRLADLANVTVGRLRNGLLQVIVVTMYLFSGLSGSKAADMAAVGTGLKDAIRKQGYDRGEIVAVLSASAVMAETVPPSIALLVLASAASLSPSALFLAGIVPALVVALCLMLAIGMRPSQTAVRPAPSSIGTIGKVALRAIPALLMPVILGRGILSGIATPTEMSSVAVIYGLFLAGPIYRQVDAAALWRLLRTSASLTGMVLLVVAAATAFSRSLLLANVPSQIATAFQHLPGGAIGFLIVSTLALVLLGQVLEGIPAILVFAPLVIPIAVQFNINPIHYGIILIVAIGLGAFSPPIGVGLYIACVIGETSIERATRAILPYLLVLLGGLLVIVFVPWFSLALPRLAHLIP
jgi:tripartite ATP-independent transporter DctM subunit